MRVLPGAASAEARRRLGHYERYRRARLRFYRRSVSLYTLTVCLGALLGASYVRFLLPRAGWPMYGLSVVAGAIACLLLIAVPQLTWVALRTQWVRLALRLGERTTGELLATAQEALASRAGAAPSPEAESDLAVIECLRGEHARAVGTLQRLYEQNHSPGAANNLLVAATETAHWWDVAWLLEHELGSAEALADANLALVAARAPQDQGIEDLWAYAQQTSCPRTLNNLGVRALQVGDYVRADEALGLAVKQRPSYAQAHANLGALAYRRGDYAPAVTQLASAAALQPGETAIVGNLGAALCQAGDPRLARRWLGRADASSPGNAALLVNLGNAGAMEGRYEEALEAYADAARAERCAAAHHNTALILLAQGRDEAALSEQRSAHEIAPDDLDILNNLGCLLWLRRHYAEASEHLERAAEGPYSGMAQANLVRAELASGRPARALDLLLQYSRSEREMQFDRGLVDLVAAARTPLEQGAVPASVRERDIPEAIACFRQVVAAGRDAVVEAHLNLGIALYLDQEYEDAAEAFAAAASRAPAAVELNYPIAVCYLVSAGQIQQPEADGYGPPAPRVQELMQKARPYLEKAVGARVVADDARLNLGILHYLLGDYPRAVTVLRPIARSDSPWEILNILAIAQARHARELQRSIQSSPLLGALRKRQIAADVERLLSAAIHSFTHVLRQQPQNPIAHANVGLAHYLRNRKDDVEQALHHWQRMRQTGGKWGERIFEIFTVAMSSEGGHRLKFHDIEVAFRPLPVEEWITSAPPHLAGLQYVVDELLDLPAPHLEAQHPVLRRALLARDRTERLRFALQRLTT